MKYIAFFLLSLLFVVVFSLVLFKQFDLPVNIIDEPINESVEVFEINFDSGQSCTSETSIKEVINLKQRCETSNDCVIAKYGCPFGCRDFMNIMNHQLVTEQVKLYRATCGNQCRYRCKSDGVKKVAACIDNLCSEVAVINGTEEKYKMIKSVKKRLDNKQ